MKAVSMVWMKALMMAVQTAVSKVAMKVLP